MGRAKAWETMDIGDDYGTPRHRLKSTLRRPIRNCIESRTEAWSRHEKSQHKAGFAVNQSLLVLSFFSVFTLETGRPIVEDAGVCFAWVTSREVVGGGVAGREVIRMIWR